MAETRESAYKAFDRCVRRFEAKYPKAMECLMKDKESLLAFYFYFVTLCLACAELCGYH